MNNWMRLPVTRFSSALAVPLLLSELFVQPLPTFAAELGLFENQGDTGNPAKTGSAEFDPGAGSYRVTGGGENMWFTNDAFHFVWKQVTGDFAFQAAIDWLHAGGNAHRKACLMVRQTLAPESPMWMWPFTAMASPRCSSAKRREA